MYEYLQEAQALLTNSPSSAGPVPEAFFSFLASQDIHYKHAVCCNDPEKTIAICQGKDISFFRVW